MRGKVPVAEIEPIGAAEVGQALERIECFSAKAPAFGRIHNSREGVGDDVEVGRDFQTVKNDVVASVDDDGQVTRVHDFIETEEKF